MVWVRVCVVHWHVSRERCVSEIAGLKPSSLVGIRSRSVDWDHENLTISQP